MTFITETVSMYIKSTHGLYPATYKHPVIKGAVKFNWMCQ